MKYKMQANKSFQSFYYSHKSTFSSLDFRLGFRVSGFLPSIVFGHMPPRLQLEIHILKKSRVNKVTTLNHTDYTGVTTTEREILCPSSSQDSSWSGSDM